MMKERPILFSGPMVRAILDGRKTQTRRVVNPQPKGIWGSGVALPGNILGVRSDAFHIHANVQSEHQFLYCPYGQPSDRLWVRHTHWRGSKGGPNDQVWDEFTRITRWREGGREINDHDLILDNAGKHILMKKKPSIHMPRWASRITLEITNVRVERLKEISRNDVVAEGVNRWFTSPQHAFAELWNSINGEDSWESNPWVWVIEFRRIQ